MLEQIQFRQIEKVSLSQDLKTVKKSLLLLSEGRGLNISWNIWYPSGLFQIISLWPYSVHPTENLHMACMSPQLRCSSGLCPQSYPLHHLSPPIYSLIHLKLLNNNNKYKNISIHTNYFSMRLSFKWLFRFVVLNYIDLFPLCATCYVLSVAVQQYSD